MGAGASANSPTSTLSVPIDLKEELHTDGNRALELLIERLGENGIYEMESHVAFMESEGVLYLEDLIFQLEEVLGHIKSQDSSRRADILHRLGEQLSRIEVRSRCSAL